MHSGGVPYWEICAATKSIIVGARSRAAVFASCHVRFFFMFEFLAISPPGRKTKAGGMKGLANNNGCAVGSYPAQVFAVGIFSPEWADGKLLNKGAFCFVTQALGFL